MKSIKNKGEISQPYRVYNPLKDKWSLVSPHRALRPWSGQIEKQEEGDFPDYDPQCYLCPGNKRVGNNINPKYTSTFIFINDHSALLPTASENSPKPEENSEFFKTEEETGICEVICYSPSHNKTMMSMSIQELEKVIDLWKERFTTIGSRQDINHVLIFENRGKEMGASNPHPHGQIWAQQHIPHLSAVEIEQQQKYFRTKGKNMLLEYLREEIKKGKRLVYENSDFAVVVPFWAEWPYETLILPKFHIDGIDRLNKKQSTNLAEILSLVTKTYAVVFDRPKYGASYTMGIHQKPTNGKDYPELQMHIHFEPPWLTSSRLKFMVGYERFAEQQRDITPEQAAEALRNALKSVKH